MPNFKTSFVDKNAVVNDTYLLEGLSLDNFIDYLENKGTSGNCDLLNGLQVDDLRNIKSQPFVQVEEASMFGGLTEEELTSKFMQLVDTRTYPTHIVPSADGGLTHLVKLTTNSLREDYVFGLFGGGSENQETPLAFMCIGTNGRGSVVRVLSGSYLGDFYFTTDGFDIDVWYGSCPATTMAIVCLNSTGDHSHPNGLSSPTKDKLFLIDYDEKISVERFDQEVASLKQELESIKLEIEEVLKNV